MITHAGVNEEDLATLGLQVFGSSQEAGGAERQGELSTLMSQPLVTVGSGFPALAKKLVARIRAYEYIDFSELPPAKGKSRPIAQPAEGQFLVVQAADLLQSRRVIPDLAVWAQCFALYVAVLAPKPEKVRDLMAYQAIIAKASIKYRWPSWVVYDQNFRQEISGNSEQTWSKVDPSIYALSFTGQASSGENWCVNCQCLDHTTQNCPMRPSKKRTWNTAMGSSPQRPAGQRPAGQRPPICLKYNKFDGDCKFGKDCRFTHACSSCKEEGHPVSKCKARGAKDHPSN